VGGFAYRLRSGVDSPCTGHHFPSFLLIKKKGKNSSCRPWGPRQTLAFSTADILLRPAPSGRLYDAALNSCRSVWECQRAAESAVARESVFAPRCRQPILDPSEFRSRLCAPRSVSGCRSLGDRVALRALPADALAASPRSDRRRTARSTEASPFTTRMTTRAAVLNVQRAYVALQAWRVSTGVWRHAARSRAVCCKALSSRSSSMSPFIRPLDRTQVFLDQPPASSSAFAVIGDEVTILQNVTIGRKQSSDRTAHRKVSGAYYLARIDHYRRSASAISPRSARLLSSSVMCAVTAPQSAFPRVLLTGPRAGVCSRRS